MDERDRFLALERAAIESASEGLKTLLLLNGGACVALLAFASSLATAEKLDEPFASLLAALPWSLMLFAGGAWLSGLAWFIAYSTNQQYANAILDPDAVKWSYPELLNKAAIGVAAGSLILFAAGTTVIAIALV